MNKQKTKLPKSLEAEQSVLGGIMISSNAYDIVSTVLSTSDFYFYSHQLIYNAMMTLISKKKHIDELTLIDLLRSQNKIEEAGGEVYIFELVKNTPSVANIVAYTEIVKDRSTLRQLIETSGEIADLAFNPLNEVDETLSIAEQKICSISKTNNPKNEAKKLPEILSDVVEQIEERSQSGGGLTGLSTGFTKLDEATNGLQKQDLIILAARPSMGKTAFAMNIIQNVALQEQKTVLFYSCEMSSNSIVERMISATSEVNLMKIKTANLSDFDFKKISKAVEILAEAKIIIDDSGGLSTRDILSRTRRIASKNPDLSLIVIDYLQLLSSGKKTENRVTEVSDISRSLKLLAKEIDVPVIALSQLSRLCESRQDKRPILSDLRDSGAVEQDADLVLLLYRDDFYNKNQDKTQKSSEVIISKNRNGSTGTFYLDFIANQTRFDNLIIR